MQVETKQVKLLDQLTLNITLIPSEPVKAWELKLQYDPGLLQLIAITEEDFFDGYQTFYVNNKSIAYGLILGRGNITTQGIIAIAHFRAVDEGEALVQIYDAGVTNETRYLSLSLQDGSVTILGLSQPHHGWRQKEKIWDITRCPQSMHEILLFLHCYHR